MTSDQQFLLSILFTTNQADVVLNQIIVISLEFAEHSVNTVAFLDRRWKR